MSEWSNDDLAKIEKAEEVQLASVRSDGTLRKEVTIWAVVHDGNVYVRAVGGPSSAWFRGLQATHQGRLRVRGFEKDVTAVEAGNQLEKEIDAANAAKYRAYAGRILNSVLTAQARSATLKLVPR